MDSFISLNHTRDFPAPVNIKLGAICHRLAAISMSNHVPNLTSPLLIGLGVGNGTDRNVDRIFLFDFYAHCRHIMHHLATILNSADRRQTDRERPTLQ